MENLEDLYFLPSEAIFPRNLSETAKVVHMCLALLLGRCAIHC